MAGTFLKQFKNSLQELKSNSPLFFTKVLNLFNEKSSPGPDPDRDLTVSVIIITANRKNDLAECLDSLVLQTRKPDEVIIIDNGQWELVEDILPVYQNSLNIRYFGESDGIPMARNAGLKCANGDILVFIDDDCIADNEWLEELIDPFLEDSTIGIVGGYLSGVGRTKRTVEKYYDFILQTKFDLS